MKTNIAPIYLREIRSLFSSPIAYLVLGMFVFIASYFFGSIVSAYSNYCQQMMYRGGGQGAQFKLMEYLFASFWGNLLVTFIFLLPLVSMRAFSEEKKSGTIEMLFTYPFSDIDILLGKYFAQLTLVGGMLLLITLHPLTLLGLASIHWPTVMVATLGLFLVCASFLALGTFTSVLSENQVVSSTLGFGSMLMLFVVDWVAKGTGGVISKVLGEVSVVGHFEAFSKGLVNIKDVSYFAIFIGFCLFGTLRVLESKKWR
jgi:ABC-2 type transport system permease protein